jgi:hypothetical protein
MKSIAGCKAEWVIRWSASREQFGGAPGPLHTKSKRFASLKNGPGKIAAMMAEIGDYEALSANMGGVEEWRADEEEASAWLDDYWRVIGESEAQEADEEAPLPDVVDQILQPPGEDEDDEEFEIAWEPGAADDEDAAEDAAVGDYGSAVRGPGPRGPGRSVADESLAGSLSLPLRFMELAAAAQDGASRTLLLLKEESLPVRLAVYHKLLGADDESYPDAWLDPATGELPTLQQLAALDRISMPTLRKRRNEAIDKLHAAHAAR